jgi:hypothetical protein
MGVPELVTRAMTEPTARDRSALSGIDAICAATGSNRS